MLLGKNQQLVGAAVGEGCHTEGVDTVALQASGQEAADQRAGAEDVGAEDVRDGVPHSPSCAQRRRVPLL